MHNTSVTCKHCNADRVLYTHSNIATEVTFFLMYSKIYLVYPITGVFEDEEDPFWALF